MKYTRSVAMRIVLLSVAGLLSALATPAFAAPTQEDVLRSISENIDQQGDSSRFFALLLAGAGLALLLIVVSRQRQRQVAPKQFNHQGKLLRELSKSLRLKSSELRQLKIIAEQEQLENPLTLLLCPSVLAKAASASAARVDRRAVAGMLRKLAIETPG